MLYGEIKLYILRSLAVSCATVYLFNIFSSVTVRFKVRARARVSCRVRVRFNIIPTCRANLVLRVIWQCDIFGMTPSPSLNYRLLREYSI